MQGHFDIWRKEARGLGDEDFLCAIKDGSIDELLASLDTSYALRQKNQVHDAFSLMVYRRVFGRFPNGFSPHTDSNPANKLYPFIVVALQTEISEPVFYHHWGANWDNPDESQWIIGAGIGAYKRFVIDNIDTTRVVLDPDGAEALHLTERWLWLPSQGVSNNIRSVGIFGARTSTTGGDYRSATARIRLKDASGFPITLNKTSSQVLLVQYTFTLYAL